MTDAFHCLQKILRSVLRIYTLKYKSVDVTVVTSTDLHSKVYIYIVKHST